jgi:hypothetical protein
MQFSLCAIVTSLNQHPVVLPVISQCCIVFFATQLQSYVASSIPLHGEKEKYDSNDLIPHKVGNVITKNAFGGFPPRIVSKYQTPLSEEMQVSCSHSS